MVLLANHPFFVQTNHEIFSGGISVSTEMVQIIYNVWFACVWNRLRKQEIIVQDDVALSHSPLGVPPYTLNTVELTVELWNIQNSVTFGLQILVQGTFLVFKIIVGS